MVDVAPTYRGCAEVCEGFVNCSAFVLEKGRCALYIGKGLPEKRGEGGGLKGYLRTLNLLCNYECQMLIAVFTYYVLCFEYHQGWS